VPESDIADGPVFASLVIVRLPLELPVAAGANTTENVLLCPAERVSGNVRPLIEYPVPLGAAAEIVIGPFDAVNFSVRVAELPTVTFPKLRDVADALNVVVIPVPLRLTVGFVEALLVNDTWPDALPEDAGANVTV
jgi:hypothetical protein